MRLIGIWLWIDARRAASWLAVGLAAVTTVACLAEGADPLPTVDSWHGMPGTMLLLFSTAVAVVAAVGEPAPSACEPRFVGAGAAAVLFRESGILTTTGLWSRGAWPLLGVSGGMLVAAPEVIDVAAAWTGGVAALASIHLVRRWGLAAADSATAVILAAGIATTAGAIVAGMPGPMISVGPAILLVVVGIWMAVVGCILAVAMAVEAVPTALLPGLVPPAIEAGGRSPGRQADVLAGFPERVPPVATRLRRALVTAEMIATLAALAGWLVLDHDQAWRYAVFALLGFMAMGVPLATLGNGSAVTAAWTRLTGRRWIMRHAAAVLARQAAILCWPLVVAGCLVGSGNAGWGVLLAATALLVVLASGMLVCLIGGWWMASGEALQAATFAALIASAAGVAWFAAPARPAASARGAFPFAVEPLAGSCQTFPILQNESPGPPQGDSHRDG